MSLVDYASSDEDEAEVGEEERDVSVVTKDESDVSNENPPPPPLPPLLPQRQRPGPSSSQISGISSHASEPSAVTLPDASFLLNSPNIESHLVNSYDHSSRVAAAMAENASRKREANGSASAFPRGKVPRGNLLHSRRAPDTGGGLLVPPQLSGRSNVVTEDISKLFVRKQTEPEPSS